MSKKTVENQITNQEKDLEEQYLLLEEEEQKEKKRKLIFLIIVFVLIIIISVIGATFSYEKYKHHHTPVETCTVNCHTNKDKKPDLNIDYEDDGYAHFNIDTNGDNKPDFNLMNKDVDNDGTCDLNCDNNKDGWPDFNIDLDGDGIADLNIKDNDNKLINMDTDGDGICDVKCNGIKAEDSGDDENDVILTMDYEETNIFYIGVTKTYAARDIIPGWKDVVEFKIKNNTPINGYYSLNWQEVINTITTTNNITYRLSKNNMLVLDETSAPYDKEEILNKVLITPNTTHTYKIELEFKETGVDQSIDINKEFRATLVAEAKY